MAYQPMPTIFYSFFHPTYSITNRGLFYCFVLNLTKNMENSFFSPTYLLCTRLLSTRIIRHTSSWATLSVLRRGRDRTEHRLPARLVVRWIRHDRVSCGQPVPGRIFTSNFMPAGRILPIDRSVRRYALRRGRVLQCVRPHCAVVRVSAWPRVSARLGVCRAVPGRTGTVL
jgi:hypothetical protein